MSEITMPSLSDSMETGTVLRWLKAAGDAVAVGDELVEIETDKATMTYESPGAGVLADPVPEGGSYAVGEVIATLGAGAAAEPTAAVAEPTVAEPTVAEPTLVAAAPAAIATNGSSGSVAPVTRVRATPLARRIAAAHRIDLGSLAGSGPRGRITISDVSTAAGLPVTRPAAPVLAPAPVPDPVGDPDAETRELTRTQQVIARRMAESKATVPHFQVQTEAQLDAVIALRAQLKELTEPAPSINDFIVKACAIALRAFPLANGSYRADRFELHDHVNVGIAVATDDALIVPTITDADRRSLGSIAQESRRLAGAVRDGTVTPAQLSGATFTISNLGMYGMTAITPVVNVPQAAILGVGAARPVLARDGEEIVECQLATLSLSCDHRILYGAQAAQFLSRIRSVLESPLPLML